jgi:hypothetical protein
MAYKSDRVCCKVVPVRRLPDVVFKSTIVGPGSDDLHPNWLVVVRSKENMDTYDLYNIVVLDISMVQELSQESLSKQRYQRT